MSDTPRMERASNESIAAVYEQGCQLERELADSTELIRDIHELSEVVGGQEEIRKKLNRFLANTTEARREERSSTLCVIERELVEVTKQRDELADALNQLMDVVATTDAAYDDRWATEIEINDAWHAGNKALKTLKGGQP